MFEHILLVLTALAWLRERGRAQRLDAQGKAREAELLGILRTMGGDVERLMNTFMLEVFPALAQRKTCAFCKGRLKTTDLLRAFREGITSATCASCEGSFKTRL